MSAQPLGVNVPIAEMPVSLLGVDTVQVADSDEAKNELFVRTNNPEVSMWPYLMNIK